MRRLKKGIATVMVCTMVFGMSSLGVNASTKSGSVSGASYTFKTTIATSSGTMSTTLGASGAVTINGTYRYVNPNTGATGTLTHGSGAAKSVSKTFTAPTGTRSVKIECTHTAAYNGTTVKSTTSEIR